MKMDCLWCGREVSLNHSIFYNYKGEIKCFICNSMMKIVTKDGALCSADLLNEEPETLRYGSSHRIIDQLGT